MITLTLLRQAVKPSIFYKFHAVGINHFSSRLQMVTLGLLRLYSPQNPQQSLIGLRQLSQGLRVSDS